MSTSSTSSSRIVIVILIPPGGVHGSSTASWRTQGQLRPWLIGQCILRTQEHEMACAARHVCVRVGIRRLSQGGPFVRLQLQLLLMLVMLQVLVLRLVRIVRAMRFSLAHSQSGRIGRGLGSSLVHGSGGRCHVTATATGCAGSTTAATNATATAAASSKRHILFALAFGCIQDHHDKGSKFRPRFRLCPKLHSLAHLVHAHSQLTHTRYDTHAAPQTNTHPTSSSSDLPQFKTCRGCPTSQAPGAAVVPVNTQCICNTQYSRHSEWYNRGIPARSTVFSCRTYTMDTSTTERTSSQAKVQFPRERQQPKLRRGGYYKRRERETSTV
jgi:hypothetical protein